MTSYLVSAQIFAGGAPLISAGARPAGAPRPAQSQDGSQRARLVAPSMLLGLPEPHRPPGCSYPQGGSKTSSCGQGAARRGGRRELAGSKVAGQRPSPGAPAGAPAQARRAARATPRPALQLCAQASGGGQGVRGGGGGDSWLSPPAPRAPARPLLNNSLLPQDTDLSPPRPTDPQQLCPEHSSLPGAFLVCSLLPH